MPSFNLKVVDPSWRECLTQGLQALDPAYLKHLMRSNDWLPGPEKIFNAFSLPLSKVNYVLFGESPYPRRESANGYAFWDAAINELWSPTGFSKKTNRATSMRNILKMLLIAEGALKPPHYTQSDIANLSKQPFVHTNQELFTNLLQQGFLLLNATPVLQADSPRKDARAWLPFTQKILTCLIQQRPQVKFILLGQIANTIDQLIPHPHLEKLYAEHPYNVSFITNPKVIRFFQPLHLLRRG
jgi:uracil-DNA glycosylase